MLRDVLTGHRSRRRRARTLSELNRLDARPRADFGLPAEGDLCMVGPSWTTEIVIRR